jgi:uncharacterized protein (TIGR02118 family)
VIKVVAALKRKPGLTLDAFSAYYFDQHAPLFRRVVPPEVAAGIKHYVQNHALQLGHGTSEAPYDCVTEMGFDDLDAMQRWADWYASPAGKVLRDDEENFMDRGKRVVVVTVERVPA